MTSLIKRRRLAPWWTRSVAAGGLQPLVVGIKIHNPARWELDASERLSLLVSEAQRQILERVQLGLVITRDKEDETKVAAADLTFRVDARQAARVRANMNGDPNPITGKPLKNSYNFTQCEPDGDGFLVTARIARGEWRETTNEKTGEVKRWHNLSILPATLILQQLLGQYVGAPLLDVLPADLKAAAMQDAAQEVGSHIGLVESKRVRHEVSFPTIASRDPVVRKADRDAAIDEIVADIRPMHRIKAREKDPRKYAPDDERGDRMIIDDPRWKRVITSPDPHPIPLHFVKGDAVMILEGKTRFPLGTMNADKHRAPGKRSGKDTREDRVRHQEHTGYRASRRGGRRGRRRIERFERTGAMRMRQWYAAVPVLSCMDPEFRGIVDGRSQQETSRGLDLTLQPMPVTGKEGKRFRVDPAKHMLLQLSVSEGRVARLLRRRDLKIAWSRLVKERDDWYLQLTLQVPTEVAQEYHRILAVSFDLDATARWTIVEEDERVIECGVVSPNPHIRAFLEQKFRLEWDQKKGRWIGGRKFKKRLAAIAHRVANMLVELSVRHRAVLSLLDLAWVQKQGKDSALNVLFTALNYGQMKRFIGYKSVLVGTLSPSFIPDFYPNFTCSSCGACRTGKEKKDEEPLTYWEKGELHCRNCGWSGVPTPEERHAVHVRHSVRVWRQRWKAMERRKREKQKE